MKAGSLQYWSKPEVLGGWVEAQEIDPAGRELGELVGKENHAGREK